MVSYKREVCNISGPVANMNDYWAVVCVVDIMRGLRIIAYWISVCHCALIVESDKVPLKFPSNKLIPRPKYKHQIMILCSCYSYFNLWSQTECELTRSTSSFPCRNLYNTHTHTNTNTVIYVIRMWELQTWQTNREMLHSQLCGQNKIVY